MHQKIQSQLIEIFKTDSGVVYQCNHKNIFVVEFLGHRSSFPIINLFDFTRRISSIDINEMLYGTSPKSDIAIIMPQYIDRCFILTLKDVVTLKELLCGAKVMIQLNSMVNECLLQFA